MDRRKILLGSAGAVTTLVAGCAGNTGSESSAGNGADDDHPGNGDDQGNGNGDNRGNGNGDDQGNEQGGKENGEGQGNGEDRGRPEDIPGFVPGKFELDSDLIRIEEFERRGRKLTVCLVVMTDDLAELRQEFDRLAPALESVITDAEGFFNEIDEIEFTLENKSRETLISLYLNAARLREFMDGDLTNEELMNMARREIEQE